MAMTSWSTTAASNVLANTGINCDEGMAPSAVNDSIREIMAVLKTAIDTGNLTATGTTFNLVNATATTVNFAGAASVALNIGHASAAAAFAGGISIPTGKSVTGTGTATITGFNTIKAATGIAVGGATPGTGGLAFPATAVAVADVNTLDDYQEGTFTGTLTGCTTSPTGTFRYVKVGKLVTISGPAATFAATSNDTTKTITGLPTEFYPSTEVWNVAPTSDNGAAYAMGRLLLRTDGVLQFFVSLNAGVAWTASGAAELYVPTFSYSL